ncbi:hypothetical protein NDU88_005728 [Pleurodeles waltl]|uniref:Uncharacterized protein n=1 Tax=Pleurodeles waltl TaxID=8319 RepID=A0AAV7PPE1_PLEWA|nr:hypothetical protein NDU88_005728 [Pleurodeles waltl]
MSEVVVHGIHEEGAATVAQARAIPWITRACCTVTAATIHFHQAVDLTLVRGQRQAIPSRWCSAIALSLTLHRPVHDELDGLLAAQEEEDCWKAPRTAAFDRRDLYLAVSFVSPIASPRCDSCLL